MILWARGLLVAVGGRTLRVVTRCALPFLQQVTSARAQSQQGLTSDKTADEEKMRKDNHQSRPAPVNNIAQLVSIFLLGAAVLTASVRATQGAWLPHVYGASRPDLWEVQVDNGDYFVIKNPATSAARKTRPIQELSLRPEVHEVVGHMFRFGLKHPVCNLPILKPTWWMTNASYLAHQLGQTCRWKRTRALLGRKHRTAGGSLYPAAGKVGRFGGRKCHDPALSFGRTVA